MTRLRARVAERLKGAQNTYAMLTTFNEIDMTNLMKLRTDFKVSYTSHCADACLFRTVSCMAPEGAPVHVLQDVPNTCNVKSSPNLSLTFLSAQDLFLETHGVKLGFMSAFVKASADALLKVPAVNAVIDGDEIIYRDYTDVSIAVATPKGLVVPVLRNVDSLSFAEVEKVRAL